MNNKTPFIFLCGCPRSGTTIMSHVLNSHERVVLGIERYKFLARASRIHEITREKFELERFFDFRDGETNLAPQFSERWKTHYEALEKKAQQPGLLWGDKFPGYFHFYQHLASEFGNVRFIFMLREFDDVASSFQVRHDDPVDSWVNAADAAVTIWNTSLEKTQGYLAREGHQPLLVCDYEAYFRGDPGQDERLLDFLGLDDCESFRKRLVGARKRYAQLCREKQLVLDAPELHQLRARARLDLAEQLRAEKS
jgi:hypothetical protein